MIVLRRYPPLVTAGAAAIFILICFALFSGTKHAKTIVPYAANYLRPSVLEVTNTTLGFEKIFVLNFPGRHDKRDGMAMGASVSNIDFEWLDGVDGASMSAKSKPPKIETALERDNGTLGCWRAHMNAMQRIVKDRIQTALVMEDDADWDVNVRKQLIEFAHGAKYIQESEDKSSRSPYGDDWDILWIGHCGVTDKIHDQRYYVIRNDPTTVPEELFVWNARPNLTPPTLNSTFNRVIYNARGGRCAYAYAVSLRGARNLLDVETLSLEVAMPADRALARLCHGEKYGARCIAPYPSIFGSHKAAGPMSKDSDRQSIEGSWREVGETSHVVFSTRLNLKSMMGIQRGETHGDVFTSQWPEKTLVKEFRNELEYPQGEGVWVKEEEYILPEKN